MKTFSNNDFDTFNDLDIGKCPCTTSFDNLFEGLCELWSEVLMAWDPLRNVYELLIQIL